MRGHAAPLTRALAASLLVACRRADPPDAPAGRAAPPPAEATRRAPEPGVDCLAPFVRGGTISGAVRWEGPRPALPPFAVGPVGNPAVCGAAQPLESLVVGDDGGVAFTVVSLVDVAAGRAPDAAAVTVDQTGCRYVPHVAAAALGVEARFTNSDRGAIHNVHAYFGYDDEDNWFNSTTPFGIATSRVVRRPGVALLTCDAGHVWMTGYLLAFPHPYFAVTDARGRFEIRDVPPGAYTLRAWHEGMTVTRREGTGRPHFAPPITADRAVAVPPDGRAEVAWTLRADGFAR